MYKKMPAGRSDFKELIENNFYYIDKTLFIKDLLDNKGEVNLITRPRRFSKTLNLSMLKYFFKNSEEDNSKLFDNLAISKYDECKQHQGKYPVIFITLKDIRCNNWEETYEKFKNLIQSVFGEFSYLLESNKLEIEEKDCIKKILNLTATSPDYTNSLLELTYYLFKHHGIRPIILIDNYDIPLRSGFINNFYDDIESFMCNWLSGGLKDNTYLEFAVLVGPLRTPKGDIFGGLNNLEHFSINDKQYSEYFGFTTNEVQKITNDFGCEEKLAEIKQWYGGYNFADLEIYSPLSVSDYIYANYKAKSYLSAVSSNSIIHNLIRYADNALKQDLELLLKGEKLESLIDTNIDYRDIKKSTDNLYSFLVLTEYLTIVDSREFIGISFCTLTIPNKEIFYIYQDEIISQLESGLFSKNMYDMLYALLQKDIESFKNIFQSLVLNTISYINSSESFYHSLVLGMIALVVDTHYVKSNRENDYNRFDIMLIPKDKNLQGIILEFKAVDKKEDLHSKAEEALRQIEDKKYETELLDIGIKEFYKYGIAFCGKEMEMLSK